MRIDDGSLWNPQPKKKQVLEHPAMYQSTQRSWDVSKLEPWPSSCSEKFMTSDILAMVKTYLCLVIPLVVITHHSYVPPLGSAFFCIMLYQASCGFHLVNSHHDRNVLETLHNDPPMTLSTAQLGSIGLCLMVLEMSWNGHHDEMHPAKPGWVPSFSSKWNKFSTTRESERPPQLTRCEKEGWTTRHPWDIMQRSMQPRFDRDSDCRDL